MQDKLDIDEVVKSTLEKLGFQITAPEKGNKKTTSVKVYANYIQDKFLKQTK